MAKLPVALYNPRYEEEYTVSSDSEIITYCELVMQDHRTEKYARIDFLLDCYNRWDEVLELWTMNERTAQQRIWDMYVQQKPTEIEEVCVGDMDDPPPEGGALAGV